VAFATQFLAATIRTATPLLFAGLGETLAEQSGIINVGLEGIMITGALGGLLGAALGGVMTGFLMAALSGAVLAAVFALFATGLRADQIVTGTAITLVGLGLTGTAYRWTYGATGAALSIPTMHPAAVPGLSAIPIVGPALFDQPSVTYVGYVLVPILWWWTYRTHAGLALRAVGQNPAAARAAGVSPRAVQYGATIVGGVLGGVAGGILVLAQVGTFAEGMTAGRGFIAIAIVALGHWDPLGAAIAALAFGAVSALQYVFQAMGWHAPYQLFLAVPYAATLIALATMGERRAPAMLGIRDKEP
jgi:general nucleoside transport system permease protein